MSTKRQNQNAAQILSQRQRKAAKILAVLHNFLGKDLSHIHCLDVGCADGTMLREFAGDFRSAIGIDPARPVYFTHATPRICARGEALPFPDERFDLVICAQVYEHVSHPTQLADEIRRVLKPGGVVFFSGPNRYALIEEHYHLPLLSWLPRGVANAYMRITHRGLTYNIRPMSYKQVRRLWQSFEIHDYTPKLLQNPAHYHVAERVGMKIPRQLGKFLRPLVPNFNWILRKPHTPGGDGNGVRAKCNILAPDAYTQDYYLDECNGYKEFAQSRGESLPKRLAYPLDLAQIEAGQYVLDIGCGRGELALHCSRQGARVWGLDYAPEALKLTRLLSTPHNVAFQQADAQSLPFSAAQFDTIFMLDVVEHLTPRQLDRVLLDAYRVLIPGGQLIIHTMPNVWYYRWGYPIYRQIQILRGHNLPRNPRQRWAYAGLHVNEQNPRQLQKTLLDNGFQPRVWLRNMQSFVNESSPLVRAIQTLLTRLPIIKSIFCNDIFAAARKPT